MDWDLLCNTLCSRGQPSVWIAIYDRFNPVADGNQFSERRGQGTDETAG